MEEKRKDLKSTHQKEVIQEIVEDLNKTHPNFYYLSTVEVAIEIEKYINERAGPASGGRPTGGRPTGKLSHDKHELVKTLSRRDIQILLSLHGK